MNIARETDLLEKGLVSDFGGCAENVSQQSEPDRFYLEGHSKTFLTHRLLRDACISVYNALGFLHEACPLDVMAELSGPEGGRRIVAGAYDNRFSVSVAEIPDVRPPARLLRAYSIDLSGAAGPLNKYFPFTLSHVVK